MKPAKDLKRGEQQWERYRDTDGYERFFLEWKNEKGHYLCADERTLEKCYAEKERVEEKL